MFSCELYEAFKNTFFPKHLFLKIWKFIYERGRPQLPDKKLFWKYLENIQEHICIWLQVTSSVKLKIGWIHITIKVPQNLENKLTVIFFKGFFKLANMPGWGLFLGELILLQKVAQDILKSLN